MRLGAAALIYFLATVGEAQVPASEPFPTAGPLYDLYHDTAKDLRCPTCTGLSVLESEAKFSEQIKGIVKEQLQAGKSKDEIFQYFIERYGPWILRAPPKTGFNVIAWLFPLMLLVGGPPLVWFFVWRRRREIPTFGVRASEQVIAEMRLHLERRRAVAPKEAK